MDKHAHQVSPAGVWKKRASAYAGGAAKSMMPAKVKCSKCKKYKPCDRHHVTYNPDVIVKLCRTCHKKITLVNTIAAVLTRKKMDNILRAVCWLWFKDYKGKITTEAVAGFLKINVVLTLQQERFIKAAKKRMRG